MAKKLASKNQFHAKLAFWLSLGFWIPLFNIGFATVAIWQGVKALRYIESDAKTFGGRGLAIAAIIIGVTTLVLTTVGIVFYATRYLTCGPIELSASLI